MVAQRADYNRDGHVGQHEEAGYRAPGAETCPVKRGRYDTRKSIQVAALVLRTNSTLDLPCSSSPQNSTGDHHGSAGPSCICQCRASAKPLFRLGER